MPERSSPPDDLAASLRRVISDQRPETLYDAQGDPVAILVPVAEPETPAAREQFLQALRAWRQGDPTEQRHEWEQLEAVLKEERLLEPPA